MRFATPDGAPLDIAVTALIIAGWTGRDKAAVRHHIDELAVLGVAPPSRTPLFYRVSASLLTHASAIDVLGPDTSGEAEPLVIRAGGRLWLGLASDHTDRALEAHSVAASKQACAKPCATELWDFDDLSGRLDTLRLRSWTHEGGDWVPYQDGSLAQILPLHDLVAAAGLRDGAAMLGGTLPALGGVRPTPRFRADLHDPVRDRSIALDYAAAALPIVA